MTSHLPADDIYSLEQWAKEKALEAHRNWWECQQNCHGIECDYDDGACMSTSCTWRGKEEMANEVIAKIQNMRCNQRPHVTQMKEEFDV